MFIQYNIVMEGEKMRWYEKVGYKIKFIGSEWIIECPEWWVGGFKTKDEAIEYIEYLW